MTSKLGRIRIQSHNTFGTPLPHAGLEGLALGYMVPHETAEDCWLTRIALDNGFVYDVSDVILENIEADAVAELTRPPLPPITTLEEQTEETERLARLFELMEQNRAEILEVETRIKAEQNRIAAEIRGQHTQLYESQRLTQAVYTEHEKRLQDGAETLWHMAGQPDKGKTYGAAQIADDWYVETFDYDLALAWAKTQVPNLVSTVLDAEAFKKAVIHGKVGTLKGVPEEVCKWTKGYKVKTLTAAFRKKESG